VSTGSAGSVLSEDDTPGWAAYALRNAELFPERQDNADPRAPYHPSMEWFDLTVKLPFAWDQQVLYLASARPAGFPSRHTEELCLEDFNCIELLHRLGVIEIYSVV
jgi:hypothetical protein